MPRRFVPLALAALACADAAPRVGMFDHLYGPPAGSFLHVSSYDTTGGNRDRLEIAPGDSAVLLDMQGPAVVRRVWITVASRDTHYLRRIALEMYWDHETEPSVSVPLGDFFGNGFDRRHYTALPMGVSSGGFYSYLPMPFRRRGRIVVRNGTGLPIDAFYYNIGVEREAKLSGDVATFHASWRRDERTARPEPHLVLDAAGRGRFVGLSLNAESYNGSLSFLEGDEIFTVDGEFRGQGTGTEDYFNGGWYFDQGAFAGAFHGVVVKDDALGRIAAYRWHLTDPIPFHDSIRIELEHGHAGEQVADYATTAYWYQTEPHRPLPVLPPPGARRMLAVKIPPRATLADAFEVRRHAEGIAISITVPRPDRYSVSVFPTGGPQGRTAVFTVAGTDRRRSVDLLRSEHQVLPPLPLGEVTAAREVTVVTSASPAVLPAALLLEPVYRWAASWNVVGPFPNPQRLGTEVSPALDTVFGPERDRRLGSTYRDVNGQTVSWRAAAAGPDGLVRLNPIFRPNDWVAALGLAYLYAPTARAATLLLGADDAHVLWLNGDEVSRRQGRHISVADDMIVPVQLRAGWNEVLIKVADLDGGWAFQLRAADPEGVLRWSAAGR